MAPEHAPISRPSSSTSARRSSCGSTRAQPCPSSVPQHPRPPRGAVALRVRAGRRPDEQPRRARAARAGLLAADDRRQLQRPRRPVRGPPGVRDPHVSQAAPSRPQLSPLGASCCATRPQDSVLERCSVVHPVNGYGPTGPRTIPRSLRHIAPGATFRLRAWAERVPRAGRSRRPSDREPPQQPCELSSVGCDGFAGPSQPTASCGGFAGPRRPSAPGFSSPLALPS